ncbi:MAG: hypothetical protein QHC40_08205 [Sphingobium sp.]|nr:hypothetical protein [Sphingobium sp.]
MTVRYVLLLSLALFPVPAVAQGQPQSDCRAAPRLDEPWTSWPQSGDAIAGGEAAGAPRLILGKPVTATLRPADYVRFAADSGKGGRGGHGGLFTLPVKAPAKVGIALSAGAWVDVVKGTTPVAPVEHGHGPACSGIRKIVWFPLEAGIYTVQIANAPEATIRVMAADAGANR